MSIMMTKLLVLLLCPLVFCVDLQLPSDNPASDLGRQQLDHLRREAGLPRFGSCWTNALDELEKGCRNLNEKEQSFLAIQFANCFLQKSGLRTYPCKRSQKIEECLKNIDSNAFTAYSNFFTVSCKFQIKYHMSLKSMFLHLAYS